MSSIKPNLNGLEQKIEKHINLPFGQHVRRLKFHYDFCGSCRVEENKTSEHHFCYCSIFQRQELLGQRNILHKLSFAVYQEFT